MKASVVIAKTAGIESIAEGMFFEALADSILAQGHDGGFFPLPEALTEGPGARVM